MPKRWHKIDYPIHILGVEKTVRDMLVTMLRRFIIDNLKILALDTICPPTLHIHAGSFWHDKAVSKCCTMQVLIDVVLA